MAKEFRVTPWEVRGNVDYDKLVRQFGTQHITAEQAREIEELAGQRSRFLDRKIFFSQRGLSEFIEAHRKGKRVALYTGRGPSGGTHLGHLMPYYFTKYLQDAFGCDVYYQLTDDEKYLFKDNLSREDTAKYSLENALDFLAAGFDPARTHVIINTKAANVLYPLALDVAKRVTYSTAKAVFGFDDSTNIGSIFFTAMQSAPAFLPTVLAREKNKKAPPVPVLIPCAIDQDPHFRVTRDVAEKLDYPKPSLIHAKFLPALKGGEKMSASDDSTSIYVTDTPKQVAKKVGGAFTGGQATVEEQRAKGGNPDVCSVCAYLSYFFEPDNEKLTERLDAYRRGELLDGENKAYLTDKINSFLKEHNERKEKARKTLEKTLLC